MYEREASIGYGPVILLCKAPLLITKGSTGTVNIYRGNTKGSETYTTGDDKIVYAREGPIPAGSWTKITWIQGGWEPLVTEKCS